MSSLEERLGLEIWQTCANEDCDEEVNPKRIALGYKTCLKCGSPEPTRLVGQASNKSGYQLLAETDVKSMGRKTTADG